jgi:hopanoid biosynthesis associated RND transporter like protein HpnN
MPTDREREATFIARLLAALAGLCFRHPWLVLLFTAATCGAAVWFTALKLTYQTQRNDLIGKNKDYYKRWQQYVDEFGDDDDMVVVVEGDDRARIIDALEHLAGAIEQRPELFDRLFYKADLRGLRNRALMFLPAEQIRQIQDHLQGMALLLRPPVLSGLDPLFGWKSLTLQQLLDEGRRKAQVWRDGESNAEAESFFRQLAVICRAAGDTLHRSEDYRSPWRSILPEQPGMQTDMLAEPQYFFTSDGRLASLLVRPVKEDESFTYSQRSIDALRALLDGARAKFPDLQFGLTGLPVLNNDEMIASQDDSSRASWLALAGVVLMFLIAYRGLRYPLMTVTILLVGNAWALGWLTLTVGHLNILSSAFAVMLIGIGDYGVLWVMRFVHERRAGAAPAEAMRTTGLRMGPSILTAAATTALAFYAAMFADLKAVAELGWIAGSGVLLCALSCFVVMPALLALFDFRRTAQQQAAGPVLSLADYRTTRRLWLPGLMRRPYAVVAAGGLAILALAYWALYVSYDNNLLNLQSARFDSVRWERTLIERTAGMSWHALSYTTTPEEALALKARYEQLPGVSRVVELASLVPREQDRKREMLADIQKRLQPLPPRGTVVEHAFPMPADIKRSAARLRDALSGTDGGSNSAALQLDQAIGYLLSRFTEVAAVRGPDEVGRQLKAFEEYMTRDLAEDLHKLREVSTPATIHLEDLPLCLRERYIGKSGKWLLRIFSKECLWEFAPLASFVSQVCTVDSEATGKPFTTLEGLRALRSGFLWAGLYAFVAIVLVLVFEFGNVKHALVALLPLVMGLVATLGLMGLFGVMLNPANLIAFPLILGVGADNGVHVLHDFRARDRSRRFLLGHATGRGILVKALTTILGFGMLMFAQLPGMASLGLALTIGVACCMLTALVFLPALLGIVSERWQASQESAAAKHAA